MSILILQLPRRPRQAAAEAAPDGDEAPKPARRLGDELLYALTHDGVTLARQGSAMPDLLPQADAVVAVLPAEDLSWHRITLPKAPAARMRAALVGLLEDALLDEADRVHLAVAPLSKAGEPTWVAACDHEWLQAQLAPLEKAGVRVDRVAPAVWPDDPPAGYFSELPTEEGEATAMALTWSSGAGVASWPVRGSLARGLLPEPLPEGTRLFATPAVAAPAERWIGAPVTVQSPAEHLLQASRSLWNLRQFDLAPSSRGLSAVSEAWRKFRTPAWRPVRLALMAIVAVHLVGLNLAAWEQRRQLSARRAQMNDLLLQAHPDIGPVIDAPTQLRRANEALRAQAGQPGPADLEPLLQLAASAWPMQRTLQTLQYDGTALSLLAEGWSPMEIEQFRTALEASGAQVLVEGSRITLSPRKRT